MNARFAVVPLVLCGLLAFGIAGAANPAAPPMSGAVLQQMFGRFTHGALLDIQFKKHSATGTMVLAADGIAYAEWLESFTGTGGQDTGKWRIVENTLCVSWDALSSGKESCFHEYKVGDNAYESRAAEDESLDLTYSLRM